jgi:hypothetical protein
MDEYNMNFEAGGGAGGCEPGGSLWGELGKVAAEVFIAWATTDVPSLGDEKYPVTYLI